MQGSTSHPGAAIAADLYLPSLVTVPVFARHIGISRRAARRLYRSRVFPARKVAGKWVATKVAILAWLGEEQAE